MVGVLPGTPEVDVGLPVERLVPPMPDWPSPLTPPLVPPFTPLPVPPDPVSPGDLAAQMRFVYQRIRESLAKYALDFRHVVRENTYVTDMSALVDAMPYRRSIYGNGPFPTSTTIQVSQLLLPGLTIEVEVTACRVLPRPD
jgi:hypothetical protein